MSVLFFLLRFFFFAAFQKRNRLLSLFFSLSLSRPLSPHLRDVLLHPVVVPIDAVAPDVGLFRDEDARLLLFLCGRKRRRRRKRKKVSKESGQKEKKNYFASSFSLFRVLSPSLLSLALFVLLTMRSNGILSKQGEREREAKEREERQRQRLLERSKKREAKVREETKRFFLFLFRFFCV